MLTLKGYVSHSARTWVPNHTILLLCDASWFWNGTKAYISSRTYVEVNPDMEEARWLRRYARTAVEFVNEKVPEGGMYELLGFAGID